MISGTHQLLGKDDTQSCIHEWQLGDDSEA